MRDLRNERGTILIFITLLMVLLAFIVGAGLDTAHLAYVRAQGQAAVDAAALAAVSAVPTGSVAEVNNRAAAFNASNKYVGSSSNVIASANITYCQYSAADGTIRTSGVTIANANAVRVALETRNPHTGSTSGTAMRSPLFLTPVIRLFGQSVNAAENVSVSAVAVLKASPGLPIAIEQARCGQPNPQKLLQSSSNNDNSGYTTYSIHNTSAAQIRALLKKSYTCGIPPAGTGSPIQLNNGQVTGTYGDFEDLFKSNPGECYLIPVVRSGSNWNQSENIVDFAKFCPVASYPVVQNGNDKYIQGNLTCGQNPYNVSGVSCYAPTLVRDLTSGM